MFLAPVSTVEVDAETIGWRVKLKQQPCSDIQYLMLATTQRSES